MRLASCFSFICSMNFLVPDLAMVPSDDSSSSLVMPMPESLWVQAQSVGPWGLRITHRAWIANLPPLSPTDVPCCRRPVSSGMRPARQGTLPPHQTPHALDDQGGGLGVSADLDLQLRPRLVLVWLLEGHDPTGSQEAVCAGWHATGRERRSGDRSPRKFDVSMPLVFMVWQALGPILDGPSSQPLFFNKRRGMDSSAPGQAPAQHT